MKGRPADWTGVVVAHKHDCKAFIVSSHHPSCLKMARDEVKHINRWMEARTFDDLPDVPDSWFMAVIVCPGDDLTPLAAWMSTHGGERVRFYLHPGADTAALTPIRTQGHDLRHVRPERYATYGAMHQRLGQDLSDQIYEDFQPNRA